MKYTAAVLTISDKGARGERIDTSGPAICRILEEAGYEIVYTTIIPDDFETIKNELLKCADEQEIALVCTTGGTGFSPRDITPEAALSVIERETRGISELMRAESMKITNRGCLSRSVAGIRKTTMIVTLPGSEKAAKENLLAVISPLSHGMDMLYSAGSAECAAKPVKKNPPSMDAWLKEAKKDASAPKIGMYLTHNGVVRETAKAEARNGEKSLPVTGMRFSYDQKKADAAVAETYQLPGIHYVRIWLNEGELSVGDDIMYVLIGGDIRPHVTAALDFLVGKLKKECVSEEERYCIECKNMV